MAKAACIMASLTSMSKMQNPIGFRRLEHRLKRSNAAFRRFEQRFKDRNAEYNVSKTQFTTVFDTYGLSNVQASSRPRLWRVLLRCAPAGAAVDNKESEDNRQLYAASARAIGLGRGRLAAFY